MNILEIGIEEGPSLKPAWGPKYYPGSFCRWEQKDWHLFLETPNEELAQGIDFLALFPSCAAFSLMSVNRHWKKVEDGYQLISDKARETLQVIQKMEKLTELVPFWMIENPRSIMRSFWTKGTMHYITHCPYGGTRMKPTNIWTNFHWKSLPPCKPTDLCHREGTIRNIEGVDIEVVRTRRRKTRIDQTMLPLQLQRDLLQQVRLSILIEKEHPYEEPGF